MLDTLQAISQERYVPPYASALVHAGLRQNDVALECLERAFHARDVHILFLTVDPKWDARFAPIHVFIPGSIPTNRAERY